MSCSLAVLLALPLAAAAPKGAQNANQPGIAVPEVPGYERRVMEGFTLLIHTDVIKNDNDSKLERKPLEVLELELKQVSSVMNPAAAKALKQILIWVRWDDKSPLSNGRQGNSLAVYYGGHQAGLLMQGDHPLKANAVCVLSLKSLAAVHQPKSDRGKCALLHEFAHAVHHRVIGFENAQIRLAFQQGMERKLYDKDMYAATNEREFFAELSCAYLDKLSYYPYTREDLKTHDPFTFKVMEAVWAGAKVAKAKSDKTEKAPALFNLDITVDKVRLGKTLLGATVKHEDLQGRPVLLLLWHMRDPSSGSSIAKLSSLHTELADFGLITLAPYGQKAEPEEIVAAARARSPSFPILAGLGIQGFKETMKPPHCFLFDHSGQCVFRGDAFQVESELRMAVGRSIVAATGVSEFTKPLEAHVDSLRKGKPPAAILQKIVPLRKSTDSDTAEQAKLLVNSLTAVGRKRLEQAEAQKENAPVDAFLLIERLPTVFKSTELATDANKLLAQLKKNKDVAQELQARPALETVKKLDTYLNGQPGSFDPSLPKFQQANKVSLNAMRQVLQQMTKSWPQTRATEEAERIGLRYGVKGGG
jgi:hypothetical protein